MKPTIAYVTNRFDEFNRVVFNGALPQVAIRLSHARTFLGQLAYRRVRHKDGSERFGDFTLKISNLIEREQAIIDDTILHEMIHLEILHRQLRDTSAHGQIFRRRMEHINRDFGRNITIRHKTTEEEKNADTRQRTHIIGKVTLRDGTRGILVPAHTRIARFRALMGRHPQVESIEWFATNDPFYNRYPRTLTPKLYPLND